MTGANEPAPARDYIAWVELRLGTTQTRGLTFSSACWPLGMVNLSPDTRVDGDWGCGYAFDDDTILGFSHVHDWQIGALLVMLALGPVDPRGGPHGCHLRGGPRAPGPGDATAVDDPRARAHHAVPAGALQPGRAPGARAPSAGLAHAPGGVVPQARGHLRRRAGRRPAAPLGLLELRGGPPTARTRRLFRARCGTAYTRPPAMRPERPKSN